MSAIARSQAITGLCIGCLAICRAATAQESTVADELVAALETSFVATRPSEFEPLRTTKELPDGVVAALTVDPLLFGRMAEWGEGYNATDVLDGSPTTMHVISWKSRAHLVVLFVGQSSTAFLLADLAQRRGCVYSLGHGHSVMLTIRSVQAMLQPDHVGTPDPDCSRIVRF